MSEPTPSKPAFRLRRLFQFRLRTLLLLTSLVAVALGYVMNERKKVADWFREVEKRGGRIDCLRGTEQLEKHYGDPFVPEHLPTRQRWAQFVFGDLWIEGVFTIDFQGRDISDDDLSLIVKAQNLNWLNLRACKNITDEGLKSIIGLQNLEQLDLKDTSITDLGLTSLEAIPTLRFLDVRYTKVSAAGVSRLQGKLPRIQFRSRLEGFEDFDPFN